MTKFWIQIVFSVVGFLPTCVPLYFVTLRRELDIKELFHFRLKHKNGSTMTVAVSYTYTFRITESTILYLYCVLAISEFFVI